MADEPLRNSQGLAVGDINPQTGGRVVAIVANRLSDRGDDRQQALAQRERAFSAAQEDKAHDNTLADHRAALAEAQIYFQMAAQQAELEEKTKHELDAADFLTTIKDLRHDDPQFEEKTAAIAAKYPRAGVNPLVQRVLESKTRANTVYSEATKTGGAYEFPEGPAREEYQRVLKDSISPIAARAAAKNVWEGEKMITTARANGLITDEDLNWHEDPAQRSKIFKPDGGIDYNAAQAIASSRAAQVAGATYKAGAAKKRGDLAELKVDQEMEDATHRNEIAQVRADQDLVTSFFKAGPLAQDDPTNKALVAAATARLLARERKAGDASITSTAPPSASPAPLPAGPPVISTAGDMQKLKANLKPGERRTFISGGKQYEVVGQ